MPQVIADVASTTANSYVTVAEADAYFGDSFGRPSWKSTEPAIKEALVISASRILDQYMTWLGWPKDPSQSMGWPRGGVPSPISVGYSIALSQSMDFGMGNYISADTIPKNIKYAVYELAYHMLDNGGISFVNQLIDSVKVGPVAVNFTARSTDVGIPSFIEDMLIYLGEPLVPDGSQVRMARLRRS
jgi:hypothetical protein